MGNNKRGKMLPEFKEKSFFFMRQSPVSKTNRKNIRVCVTLSTCVRSLEMQQNFKQNQQNKQKSHISDQERAKINAHNYTHHHQSTKRRRSIKPTCAISQINVRACYFCVSQRIENLLIERGARLQQQAVIPKKGAEQNF